MTRTSKNLKSYHENGAALIKKYEELDLEVTQMKSV